MTPANDQPGGNPQRRSAAFPRKTARGALPPGGLNPFAAARPGGLAILLLCSALVMPAVALAEPAPRAAAKPAAARTVPRLVAEPGPVRQAVAPRVIRTSAAEDRPARAERPRATPAPAKADRQAARTPDRDRARRPGHAAPHRAQARKPRGPRDPNAAPVLRDAPLELLPAPESLDQARLNLPGSPRAACLAAARRAEQVHELPPGLLVALAMSESSLHAHAIKIGARMHYPRDPATAREILEHAPRRASPMVGCVQVNARVHAKGSDWPLDPLRATDWAGGMLRRWHQETGNWVDALRRWHGGSARTEHGVLCRVRAKLEVANPENAMLRDYPCQDTQWARVRREGRGILEVAELPE